MGLRNFIGMVCFAAGAAMALTPNLAAAQTSGKVLTSQMASVVFTELEKQIIQQYFRIQHRVDAPSRGDRSDKKCKKLKKKGKKGKSLACRRD